MPDTRSIRIIVDKEQAQRDIAALDAQLKSVGQAGQQVGQQMAGASNSVKQMASSLTNVGGGADIASRNLNNLSNSARSLRSANDNFLSLASGARSAAKDVEALGHGTAGASLQIRESLVLMREAANGNFTRMAGSASILAQSMTTSGVGIGALGMRLLTLTSILKVTKDATLAQEAASAAQNLAAIEGAASQAAGNVIVADTQVALASAQQRLAGTAAEEAAAQAALAIALKAVTKASDEAIVAQEALTLAEGTAGEAAEAAAAAEVTALGVLGTALAVLAPVAIVLGLALDSIKNQAGDDASMKQYASTLGLTHKEMEQLTDVTVTWGDTFAGVWETALDYMGVSTSKISSVWNKIWSGMGTAARVTIAGIVETVVEFTALFVSATNNIGLALAKGIQYGVNAGIDAIQGLINALSSGVNKLSGVFKALGVDLGNLGTVDLSKYKLKAVGKFSNPLTDTRNAAIKAYKGTMSFFDDAAGKTREHAQKRLKTQSDKIIGDRSPKHTKEDPMVKAADKAKEYQDNLQKSITSQTTLNALTQKLIDGDESAYSEIAQQLKAQKEQEAIEANRQKWGEQWKKLTADQQKAQNEIAKNLEDQKIIQDATAAGDQRRLAENQNLLSLKAQLAGAMTTDWRQSQQIADNEDLRAKHAEEVAKWGAAAVDPLNTVAQQQIAAADAAERQALAYKHMIADAGRVNSLISKYDPTKAANDNHDQNIASIDNYTGRQTLAAFFKGDPQALKAAQQEQDKLTQYADQEWKEETQKIAQDFADKITHATDEIADAFGQLFGSKIGDLTKQIGSAFASLQSGVNQRGNPISLLLGGFEDFSKEMGLSNTKFANMFNQYFGKNGSLVEDLAGKLNIAGQGAEVGGVVGQLGSLISPKHFNSTGAEIGGAIGSLVPGLGTLLGGVIGSTVGGLLGGIFGKTNKASTTASLDPQTGGFSVGAVTGNSDESKQAAQDFGQTISDSINQIAQTLGGQLAGSFSEKLQVKGNDNPAYYVGDQKFAQESDAVFKAVKDALMGSLQDVSDFTKRVLAASNKDNFNALMGVAGQYEQIMTEIGALKNPMTDEASQFADSMTKLYQQMEQAGATADELANVTTYRELKLKEILDDQLKSLRDFQNALTGDGSGIPELSRLNSDLAQFQQLKSDLAGGKSIDQDSYVQLGQEIFQLAGNVYGTSTSAFQDIRKELSDTTSGIIDSVTSMFTDTTVAAIQQTNTILDQQTSYLAQIAANTNSGAPTTGGTPYGGGGSASNGTYNKVTY